MKIERVKYKYIEYELFHYNEYKKILENERGQIIDSSPRPADGLPKGNTRGNTTEKKAIQLCTSTSILKLQRTINSIENFLKSCNKGYKAFFEYVYINKLRYEGVNKLMPMAEKTFYNMKTNIIYAVGMELGIL